MSIYRILPVMTWRTDIIPATREGKDLTGWKLFRCYMASWAHLRTNMSTKTIITSAFISGLS